MKPQAAWITPLRGCRAVDCGSLLPLWRRAACCPRRGALPTRSRLRPPHSGSRLPQSAGFAAALLLAFAAAAAAAPKNVPAFRASPPVGDVPDDTQPLVKSAIALMRKGDLAGAKKTLEEVLKVTPDHAVALLDLGIVEYRRRNFREAESLLQRAVRSNPELAQGWMILGVVRQDQGKLDAALAALAQAVFLDPKNARAHHYLGVTVGRKGWYSGAEDEMRKAIELQPDYAEAHFNLAVFYLQRQPPAVELARRHYQKALDLGAAPDAEVARSIDK